MSSFVQRLVMHTVVVAIFGLPAFAWCQKFPPQFIRIIVPTTPGGAVDAFGRGIGRRFEQTFGITAVVENRAGANGAIGATFVAKAPPDGSTLLVIFPSHVVNPLFTKNLGYEPIRDFTPIIRIGNIPLILVTHPSIPATSVKELVALAKAKPAMLSFGSGGVGSGGHLSGELLKYMTKIDILHVAYKGNALALTDVRGGHISMMFDTITTGLPHVGQGKLRLLAVTSAERVAQTPQTPTMIESGFPGFETDAWYALLGPAQLPRDIVDKVNSELNKAFGDQAFRANFVAQGVRFVGGSPEELDAHMKSESKRWAEVIAAGSMKPE
jgi:tripartite-type tricarboxylate transporter receptor subunit TctC